MAFEHEIRLDALEPNHGNAFEIVREFSKAVECALPGDRGRQLQRAARAFARLVDCGVISFQEAHARLLFSATVCSLCADDGRGAVADRIETLLKQAPERKPMSIIPTITVKTNRGGRPLAA